MMDDSETTVDTDERPSRSERKREAHAVRDLAAGMVTLSPAQLDRIDLPDGIRAEIDRVRGISAHVARKRELGFLAKLMRRCDESELDAARAALGANREQQLREAAGQRRIETLREALIEHDDALTALLEQHPGLDRQHLRSLIRQARSERTRDKPPRAARQLFRMLRDL